MHDEQIQYQVYHSAVSENVVQEIAQIPVQLENKKIFEQRDRPYQDIQVL